jgi:hypothetical protein
VDPLLSTALKDSIWPTLFSIAAVVVVLGVLFTVYATRIIYEDHQNFVAAVATLRAERDSSRAEVEERKHTLRFNDGAFYNMTHLIGVFMAFRRAIGPDAKCMWLITSPEDNPLVGVVMTLAVVGSNCPNGNLQNLGIKPEHVEEENRKGMVAGRIVIHALPKHQRCQRAYRQSGEPDSSAARLHASRNSAARRELHLAPVRSWRQTQ